jgi:beta-lactamase class A
MIKNIRTHINSIDKTKILLFLVVFIVGFVVGSMINSGYATGIGSNSDGKYSIRLADPNNPLIYPPLISDSGAPGDKNLADKFKLETYDLLNIPQIQTISIYYRDMKTGTWAGVGENTEFDPGSLLKVPIMIAWLREAQENPSVLQQKLLFSGPLSDSGGDQFASLTAGTWYTVDQLLTSMITKSDNDAKDVLLSNLTPVIINSVFSDLGIVSWGDTAGTSEKISANVYSRFLRVLYNATYLNHEYSEKALELLNTTSFDDGIRSGVPKRINVAHKFGQFQASPISPIELSDCGIVYEPSHPYLLCVMTRGDKTIELETLQSVIQSVSKNVYTMVSTNSIDLSKN